MTATTTRLRGGAALAALALIAGLGPAAPAAAAPALDVLDTPVTLDHGHIDAFNLSLNPDDSARLTLKEDVTGTHVLHTPESVELYVKPSAWVTGAPAAYLPPGAPSDFYLLPLTQDPSLIWPGWDSNDVGSRFGSDADVDINISAVDGPGEVYLWTAGSFGAPATLLNEGRWKLPGVIHQTQLAHVHANWGFTAKGTYQLTVQATVTSQDGTLSSTTQTAAYAFVVAERTEPTPEPTSTVIPDPTPTPTATPEPTPTDTPTPEPVAPVARTNPSVTGAPAVGSTLTAKPGAWSVDGLTFSYQWLRNGAAIPGAAKAAYRVGAADAGKSLQVLVTAAKPGLPDGTATSAAVKAGKKLTKTPTPGISGSGKVGKTLKAKVGSWKPSKITLKHQWLRDGQPIGKATKSSYKLAKADAGRKVTVRVTGSKSGYLSVEKTSKAKSVAKVKASLKLSLPSKVGKGKPATATVTVKAAAAKPTGTVTLTVSGKKLTGVLTAADNGKVSVKLPPIAKKGSYKVKAFFAPTDDTAKSTSKSSTVSKTLKVR